MNGYFVRLLDLMHVMMEIYIILEDFLVMMLDAYGREM